MFCGLPGHVKMQVHVSCEDKLAVISPSESLRQNGKKKTSNSLKKLILKIYIFVEIFPIT